MRKRAQIKSKPTTYEPKHITEKRIPKIEEKPKKPKKNWWIALTLIAIFFLVLFLNTYFNLTSDIAIYEDGEGFDRYLLSGPDPYYNLRIVQSTYETGKYQYYSETDPLLNYPLGARGGRAPLLNMIALGFSKLLTPFMSELDAIGRSMQFIPALFGALLIFPVYFIGKHLFNKKAGLIAAFFITVIPIHISSGHGSAYSLFDHDSLNLLLFFLTFLFLIVSLKEKDRTKSILYAVLAGVPLAALTMVWVEARFLYVIIAGYTIVQMVIDIFTSKIAKGVFWSTSVTMLSGYLISLPVIIAKPEGFTLDVSLLMVLVVIGFGLLYYIFGVKKVPWTISLSFIFIVGAGALVFLYFVKDLVTSFPILSHVEKLSNILFGTGIYGNKVSMTIAEANTYQISHTVMSFGPALYWLGWAGFILLLLYYYREKIKREYLFIIVLFIIDLWLATTAGRFLNDMVPLIAILAGFITWYFVDKINYKQMIRNIKSAGGGLHGIRRGVKFLHIFGVIFLAFIVLLPSVFIAFDAAVPSKIYQKEDGNYTNLKWEMFGEDYSGAFGLGVGKEVYWTNAFNWLSTQDTDIELDVDRPAFISWWDYGFYEAALGGHPTVADNFQDGIPPASNFHTATSEKEAVSVWIIRLLEGDILKNEGALSDEVKNILEKHLGNDSEKVITWMQNPTDESTSYGDLINETYMKYVDEEINPQLLTVGAQWRINAVYHDFAALMNNYTDEQVTWLYHDIQDVTDLSIRYYGVEGYDRQIFNIFAFLSDKSLILVGAPKDDFIELTFTGATYYPQSEEIERNYDNEPLETFLDLSIADKRRTVVETTGQKYKDEYFETMFYKTYIGPKGTSETGENDIYRWQIPCLDMIHFYAEFISDLTDVRYQYQNSGKAAVVIAKYYEGAIINGTVKFNNQPINATVIVQKNLTFYGDVQIPIDHDKFEFIAEGNFTTDQFNVIAGAGSQIQIQKVIGETIFPMKNITFEGEGNLAPISEEDAMRRSDNYERYLNITIDSANIEGYVFNDTDDDGIFNITVDKPIENISVTIWEILETQGERITQFEVTPIQLLNLENGYYNYSGLEPGIYQISIDDKDGYNIALFGAVPFYEGNNTYNATLQKPGDITGTVYYDKNKNSVYDSNEEVLEGVDVELLFVYNKQTGATRSVANTTTLNKGVYKFENIISGNQNKYILKVKPNLPYDVSEEEVYVEANTSTDYNLSVGLAPITVSGTTSYDGNFIEGVTINFEVDTDIEDNTAEQVETKSVINGTYSVFLQPGSYNITLQKYIGETLVYELEGEQMKLSESQLNETKNFELIKKSVSYTGITTYNEENIGDITIDYSPITNEGIFTSTISNKLGIYNVELTPGNYSVNVSYPVEENGVNVTYYYDDFIEVREEFIDIIMSKDIALERIINEE